MRLILRQVNICGLFNAEVELLAIIITVMMPKSIILNRIANQGYVVTEMKS